MERLDAAVAGIGVLVLAVAVAGVALSGPGAGGGPFTIAFAEQREALEAQQAAFTGDGASDIALEVRQRNLTVLEVTVRVTGAGPRLAPDTIAVELTGPDGRAETQQATLAPGAAADASLTFRREVAQAPEPVVVRAGSEGEALAGVPGAYTSTAGMGTWTVSISATTQGVAALHAEGHTVVVEATAVSYRAAVQAEVANPR